VGYVFQEASLFAHLSVDANLRYGLRRALRTDSSPSFRFDDVVDLLGLKHLLQRSTYELSGGERQRVAVGRALLAQPRLFLMDEPLSALDRMTKEEILPYFEALHTSFSIPVLYVSHDISEIERLADHIVLLDSGRVLASGALSEILADPALPIARGREASSVLAVRVGSYNAADGLTELEIGGQKLLVPGHVGKPGAEDRVRIAASDVSLSVERPSQTTILNVLPARVLDVQPVNEAQLNVLLSIGGQDGGPKLLARITRRAQRLLDFRPGQDVHVQVKAASLVRRPL
jgi:molybdate transport system ATP-binding protein